MFNLPLEICSNKDKSKENNTLKIPFGRSKPGTRVTYSLTEVFKKKVDEERGTEKKMIFIPSHYKFHVYNSHYQQELLLYSFITFTFLNLTKLIYNAEKCVDFYLSYNLP